MENMIVKLHSVMCLSIVGEGQCSIGAAAVTNNTHYSDAAVAVSRELCKLLNFIYSYWISVSKIISTLYCS